MGAINNRYGRGEDVKMAIRAGNDLAMICHHTDSAELAAKALGELPLGLRDDAKSRLGEVQEENQGRCLLGMKSRWAKLMEKITDISSKIPEVGEVDERSAVTRY